MLRSGVCAVALVAGLAGTAHAQVACESMKGFTAPDVKITAAVRRTVAGAAVQGRRRHRQGDQLLRLAA